MLILAPSPFLVEPSTKNVAKSKSKTPLCYENAVISNFPKFYADELSRKKGFVICFIACYFFNSNPFPLDWAMQNAVKLMFDGLQNFKNTPISIFIGFLAAQVFHEITFVWFEASSLFPLAHSLLNQVLKTLQNRSPNVQ